jgi:hypothetical protein
LLVEGVELTLIAKTTGLSIDELVLEGGNLQAIEKSDFFQKSDFFAFKMVWKFPPPVLESLI